MSKHKICRKCGKEYDHSIALNGFCSFRCEQKWKDNYDKSMLNQHRDFRKNRDNDYCNIIGLSGDCPQDYEKCPHKTGEIKDCM